MITSDLETIIDKMKIRIELSASEADELIDLIMDCWRDDLIYISENLLNLAEYLEIELERHHELGRLLVKAAKEDKEYGI